MEDNIRLTQGYMEDLQRINDLAEPEGRLDDGINYNLTLMKSLSQSKLMGGRLDPRWMSSTHTEKLNDLEAKRTLQVFSRT